MFTMLFRDFQILLLRLFAGDVKYHLGTSNVREFANGKSVLATLEAS